MSNERVWLTHPETGGTFACPADAVGAWRELGWVPCEAPPEPVSPVIAENLAWRESQAAEAAAKEADNTTTKPARRGSNPGVTDG